MRRSGSCAPAYAQLMLTSVVDARKSLLLLAIAAFVAAGVMGYIALGNERTGKASYKLGRYTPAVQITRESEPEKFRKVANFRWGISFACVGVGVVSFVFYRKLDDCA